MTFFVLQIFVLMSSTELMSLTEINQQNINKLDPAIHKFSKSDLPYCNIKQMKHFVRYSSWRFVRTNIYPDTWTSWWYNGWLVASWCWRPCSMFASWSGSAIQSAQNWRADKKADKTSPLSSASSWQEWVSTMTFPSSFISLFAM